MALILAGTWLDRFVVRRPVLEPVLLWHTARRHPKSVEESQTPLRSCLLRLACVLGVQTRSAQLARYSCRYYRSAAFWFALMLGEAALLRSACHATWTLCCSAWKLSKRRIISSRRSLPEPPWYCYAKSGVQAGQAPFLVVPKSLQKRSWTASRRRTRRTSRISTRTALEVALDTKGWNAMVTCLLQLGLLLSIQILYSFGYWDASTLQMGVSTLPAFMDTMDLSLLYSTSVLEGSNLTLVNLLCSLCSLALLALLMKNDNEGTLLTTQPLQLLLLGDGDHVLSETEQRGRMGSPQEEGRGRMRRIGQAALVLGLQTLTLCRALLLPLYAAFGAAGNFAGSSNAQDIVLVRSTQAPKPCAGLECVLSMALCAPCMAVCAPCMAVCGRMCARPASVTATPCVCARACQNSVAIGFVFELDEWLYEALLNKAKRTSFEEGAPRPYVHMANL